MLGSTGSIGTSALEVIGASDGRLRVAALSAHTKLPRLLEQARRVRPRWIVATDAEAASAKTDDTNSVLRIFIYPFPSSTL